MADVFINHIHDDQHLAGALDQLPVLHYSQR
jgi:hypothetical protein